jgi:hypothetical protein
VHPTLARLLLPFQTASSSSSTISQQDAFGAAGTPQQQPQEGDVLDLDVFSALQAVLPNRAANFTVHMRVMLGRDQAAAALSALAAAAAATGGGFGDASGLGFGKLTSQLPLPDADLDAALRKRLPNVTGFVSNNPGHVGKQE